MEQLTVQAFLNNQWCDVALITFPESEQSMYQLTELDYQSDYAIDHLNRDDNYAVSLNHPVSLFFDDGGQPSWMRFLDDIIPSGASRRYWEKYLDLEGLTPSQQNFVILKHGTMSPIGNLRIKESVPAFHPEAEQLFFLLMTLKTERVIFWITLNNVVLRQAGQQAQVARHRNYYSVAHQSSA